MGVYPGGYAGFAPICHPLVEECGEPGIVLRQTVSIDVHRSRDVGVTELPRHIDNRRTCSKKESRHSVPQVVKGVTFKR